MNKLSVIWFLSFCFPTMLFAQKIRVINSTERKWYGGIAGRSGANYTFLIEFSDFKVDPNPDTIWIGQQPIPVKTGSDNESANTKVSRNAKSIRFEISAGISKDEYADRYPVQGTAPKAIPHSPIAYKGVAMLSYTVRGQPRYFEIRKVMQEYPAANYP